MSDVDEDERAETRNSRDAGLATPPPTGPADMCRPHAVPPVRAAGFAQAMPCCSTKTEWSYVSLSWRRRLASRLVGRHDSAK